MGKLVEGSESLEDTVAPMPRKALTVAAVKAEAAKPSYDLLIRELIVSGALMPNERLVEADLAARFNTNRSNIRVALGRLDQEGLVVIEPNHGARVRVVEQDEALQIFETRGALERLVAHHAALNATPAQGRKMRALLDSMQEALDRGDLPSFSALTGKLRATMWAASRHATATRLRSRCLVVQSSRLTISVRS